MDGQPPTSYSRTKLPPTTLEMEATEALLQMSRGESGVPAPVQTPPGPPNPPPLVPLTALEMDAVEALLQMSRGELSIPAPVQAQPGLLNPPSLRFAYPEAFFYQESLNLPHPQPEVEAQIADHETYARRWELYRLLFQGARTEPGLRRFFPRHPMFATLENPDTYERRMQGYVVDFHTAVLNGINHPNSAPFVRHPYFDRSDPRVHFQIIRQNARHMPNPSPTPARPQPQMNHGMGVRPRPPVPNCPHHSSHPSQGRSIPNDQRAPSTTGGTFRYSQPVADSSARPVPPGYENYGSERQSGYGDER